MELEFFFDYGSPYSYLADSQLAGLCERTHCTLRYRPMLLGGVFKATGNRSPAEEPVVAKRRYGNEDLPRWAEYLGIPFAGNPHFPIHTLLLMRTAHAALQRGIFPAFHRVVYPAFWARGENLGVSEVIGQLLDAADLPGMALLDAARRPESKQQLRATTEEAVARGVFGAPSFFVGDQLFFGNDRLCLVEAALARR